MKRKILRFILIQSLLGMATAQAEQLFTPKDVDKEKKVVSIDFSGNEEDIEPSPHMTAIKKKAVKHKVEIGQSISPNKKIKSEKNFGTEDEGKLDRSLASVDKEKPKAISLKKALKIFKRQTDRDMNNNYE